MASYINTRIRQSADKQKWVVEGQSGSTFNWETLMTYPADRAQAQEKAINAACKLALDFSKKNRQAVTAYNTAGYAMACYLKGEPHNLRGSRT